MLARSKFDCILFLDAGLNHTCKGSSLPPEAKVLFTEESYRLSSLALLQLFLKQLQSFQVLLDLPFGNFLVPFKLAVPRDFQKTVLRAGQLMA